MEGTGHAYPDVAVGNDTVMPTRLSGEYWLVYKALEKSIAVAVIGPITKSASAKRPWTPVPRFIGLNPCFCYVLRVGIQCQRRLH